MKKLLLILVGLFILTFLWYRWSLRAPGDASQTVTVTVEKGMGVAAIAEELSEAGMIKSPRAFRWYNRWNGTQGQLKAGVYRLNAGMTVQEVVEAMTDGVNQEVKITIPEGYSVKDIDRLIASEGLAPEGAILECAQTCDFSTFDFLPPSAGLAARGGKLEGYLFPETYFVNAADFVPKFFLERLLGEFRKRVVNDLDAEIKASGHSLHEVVTMASLVEEEAKGDEQRRTVAGILWSRIEQGIGLYVDATTRYIVDKPTAALTTADLAVDSPYNTRLYRDLPPGPIANPSLQSIKATINPIETPYLYYLHGSDGQIRYAETNDEHNRNKALYLR